MPDYVRSVPRLQPYRGSAGRLVGNAYIPLGMNSVCSLPAPKGRPREFDVDEALGKALLVFWRNGYEAASMAELTGAAWVDVCALPG